MSPSKSHPNGPSANRSRVRTWPFLALCLALAVVVVDAHVAKAQSRQTARLEFTTEQPATPAGVELMVNYMNPDHPGAKPPAVRRVVTILAPGARYETSVPDRCAASDAELTARGSEACPPASVVGVGEFTIDTGTPGPQRFIKAGVDFLNNTDELIFLNAERKSGARTVLRAPIEGRRIISDVPPLPGAPPDGAALTSSRFVDFRIPEAGGGPGYITTPPRCPASGNWTNSVNFTYADGVTQTVESLSPCRPMRTCHGKQATLVGTTGDDVLRGTTGRDVIVARAGDDVVRGGAGPDLICGRAGADELRGGRGRDQLHGARGGDVERGGKGRDHLRGGYGDDLLRGGANRDRCRGGADRDQKRGCER